MDVVIDSPRTGELSEMLGVMCEAFHLPVEAAREVFFTDPYLQLENKRVLRVNGRIVSCLTFVDMTCWLGQGTARLCGLAGVATLPEFQRKGYAGLLLTDALQTLSQRGYALAALAPASFPFYRKFGWETVGFAHRYLTAPSHLPAYPEAKRVRLAHSEDVPALQRLYAQVSQGETLHCRRDTKRWNFLFKTVTQKVVYAPEPGRVEGYLLYEYRPNAMESPSPAVTLPPTLRILEMQAGTANGWRGLLGYLAGQTNVGSIEYDTTWANLNTSGLLQTIGITIDEANALASVEIVPSIMARIIRLEQTLEALSANWSGFDGSLAIILHDALTPGCCAILGSGAGKPEIRSIEVNELGQYPHWVRGEAAIWSQVCVGHISAEAACALGRLQVSSPQARERLTALFPYRAPFLPLPDHF